ncbi:non-hydrolyzing UDP-N-acetylglucosamine 2-epimerase [Parachlamydia acanthamoebae]|uniref:non-hydrolyzing UDP-N-acetylglucosamine 2-epimerase n=1 Tax=Parachlamydia acanthamoebae TaxID=83552 RepID=UPI00075141AC|nr:UDP-N-acetylglucosamine 2-epimerase (non-hydrolyzing) [Parachlamydia acanthamoebae]
MKIATIIGARPQFIKAAALSRAISEHDHIQEILIHTGQHYDRNMSDVFFSEMGIPTPTYQLGVGGCSQGAMTGRMLEKIEEILLQEKPDWVLVFGDTNSTLAGALAAVKLHIPVAHVEAGLRSFNRKMPEEINRILTDHCSNLLFTPTTYATQQLKREGVSEEKIIQAGDVMYDTALFYLEKSHQTSTILNRLNLQSKQFVLATIHRAENTDDPDRLREIFLGLSAIGRRTSVVVPLHPRTQQALQKLALLDSIKQHVTLVDPVGYLDMTQLENHARLILTDSGGVQKEAYFFKVPCLTLREETEWVELVDYGFNRLVPIQARAIEEQYDAHSSMNPDWNVSLYGNGEAAKAIVSFLK